MELLSHYLILDHQYPPPSLVFLTNFSGENSSEFFVLTTSPQKRLEDDENRILLNILQ